MRCKCGYNSFDYNLKCPKCKKDTSAIRKLLNLNLPHPGVTDFFAIAANRNFTSPSSMAAVGQETAQNIPAYEDQLEEILPIDATEQAITHAEEPEAATIFPLETDFSTVQPSHVQQAHPQVIPQQEDVHTLAGGDDGEIEIELDDVEASEPMMPPQPSAFIANPAMTTIPSQPQGFSHIEPGALPHPSDYSNPSMTMMPQQQAFVNPAATGMPQQQAFVNPAATGMPQQQAFVNPAATGMPQQQAFVNPAATGMPQQQAFVNPAATGMPQQQAFVNPAATGMPQQQAFANPAATGMPQQQAFANPAATGMPQQQAFTNPAATGMPQMIEPQAVVSDFDDIDLEISENDNITNSVMPTHSNQVMNQIQSTLKSTGDIGSASMPDVPIIDDLDTLEELDIPILDEMPQMEAAPHYSTVVPEITVEPIEDVEIQPQVAETLLTAEPVEIEGGKAKGASQADGALGDLSSLADDLDLDDLDDL